MRAQSFVHVLVAALFLAALSITRLSHAQDSAALKAEGDALMETFKYSDALDRYERAYAHVRR